KIDDLDRRPPGVDDAPVHDRVDGDRCAVFGQRLLGDEGCGCHTRVDGEWRLLDVRQQEEDAWPANAAEATKAQHHLALPFVADAQRGEDRDYQQDCDNQNTDGRWSHDSLPENKWS